MGKFRSVFNLRLGNVMMKFVSDAENGPHISGGLAAILADSP